LLRSYFVPHQRSSLPHETTTPNTVTLRVFAGSVPLCCFTKQICLQASPTTVLAILSCFRRLFPWRYGGPCSAAQPRYTAILALSLKLNLHNSPRPPQPRTATSKRLNRTRPELPAPFASQRKRASG